MWAMGYNVYIAGIYNGGGGRGMDGNVAGFKRSEEVASALLNMSCR